SVLTSRTRNTFVPHIPGPLHAAQTYYNHIANSLNISLHDHIQAMRWLAKASRDGSSYDLTPRGEKGLEVLGVDVEVTRNLRRRFAFACVDWSERRPHLGGAVGAVLLKVALKRKWVRQDLDSRILTVTSFRRQEMLCQFGLQI